MASHHEPRKVLLTSTIKVNPDPEYKAALKSWQVDGAPSSTFPLRRGKAGIPHWAPAPQPATSPAKPRQTSKALNLITADPSITAKALGAKLGVSERQVQRLLRQLREEGHVTREGPNKTGCWVIPKSDFDIPQEDVTPDKKMVKPRHLYG